MNKTHLTISRFALLANPPIEDTPGLGSVVIDVLSAEPDATDGQPSWIKISPRGTFTTRCGRTFNVDPEALVARFDKEGVKIPVDIDHATAKKAMFGDAAPAVGWVEELAAREDGLYGRVDWLAEGKSILSARTHRYVSPAWPHDDRGNVSYLHSVGLVAAPALSMPAVASAGLTKPETSMLKAIAKALGLNEDATEQSCLSAISGLVTRVDPAVHQTTLDTLAATRTELETLKKSGRDKEVHDLLEGALTAKKITPAQREAYASLCATDDGLAGVKKIIETLGVVLPESGLDKRTPADKVATLSAEDRDIMAQLGLTEEQFRKSNGLNAA